MSRAATRRSLSHWPVLGFLALGACATPTEPSPAPRTPRRAATPAPSLILTRGVVHTFDPGQPRAEAVALLGTRVLATGDSAAIEALASDETRLIDLRGRTVVPGLIDAHFHVFGVGQAQASLNLVGTRSIEDVKTRVAQAAKAAAPGAWIVGRGWDQNDWDGERGFPSARDLDGVSDGHPVVLHRVDGHALWANGAAMKAAGVGPDTRDPPGGRVLREGRAPSGVFVDNAMGLVEGAVPSPTVSELRKSYFLGEREALRHGLTEIQDMGLGRAELDVLLALDKAGELKLRVYAMVDGGVEDFARILDYGPRIPAPESPDRLTIRGVKFYLDGALGSRGAALLAPYSDDPRNSGLILMDPALFEARVRTARDRGFQVATHAIGDRANRLALDVYERVFGETLWKARPRIEHAQVISPADLPRFGRLGVIASMQPVHATSDAPWAGRRLGRERLKGAYAWRSLLATTATIASGSDAPVESASAIGGLVAAIFRESPEELAAKTQGRVERNASGGMSIMDPGLMESAPFTPEERMEPQAALASFTRGAAFASFREGEAGRIAPGAVADLTILTADPLSADGPTLARAKVDLTIVGGVLAYTRPGTDVAPPPGPVPPPEPVSAPPPGPAPVGSTVTATTAP